MSIVKTGASEPVREGGEYNGFRYELISPNTTNTTLKIYIPDGETVKAIPGCMVATSPNITIKGKVKKTFKALLGPEDSTYQTLSANDGEGWVLLAPGFYGSIQAVPINGEEICVGDDAFLASLGEIESSVKSQGMKKAMFSGSGLFVKKVKGTGIIFVCAVGSMMTYKLADAQEIIVDNGHLVTWPSTMKYDVQKASKSWFGSSVSGEGVVTRLTGPALINIQTRNPEEMAGWIYDTKTPPTGGGGG